MSEHLREQGGRPAAENELDSPGASFAIEPVIEIAPEPVIEIAPEPVPAAAAPGDRGNEERSLAALILDGDDGLATGAGGEAGGGEPAPDLMTSATAVAPQVPDLQAVIENIKALEQEAAALDQLVAGEAKQSRLDAARKVSTVGSAVLDAFPKGDDPVRASYREQLLEAYFALQRRIEVHEAVREAAPPRRRPSLETKPAPRQRGLTTSLVTPLAVLVKKRRRTIKLLVVVVILVGVNAAVFLRGGEVVPPEPEVTHARRGGGVVTTATQGAKRVEDLKQGIPVITYLSLFPVERRGLRARAMVTDVDSPPPRVIYTWYRDGKVIKEEEAGFLPAEVLRSGQYKVRAVARDTTRASAPLETAEIPVVIGR